MPKRKENRTKGNTRPASSSRMADKLAMAGELKKFVGFDSLSGGSGAGTEQVDGGSHDQMFNSDAHFMTVLKQLGKRDTTTKLKALAEFSSYCESQPVSELKCGLSIWPLMFNKLCTDNDHRVREAMHKAMAAFLAKVRKDFQPHLKTVMGAWAAGMNDSHSSASSAAIATFTDTFSIDRQQQVFQFTFKEIIQYMDDIVLVQNADTYTDPKSYTADERIKRYEMAVAMAILGVRYTLDQLSEGFISEEGSRDVIDQVVKKPAFLKLTKNPNPTIRAAFFKLMSVYLQKQNLDVSQPGKQLCQAVFSGLRETDPSAVVSAWEAMLVVMSKLENWSQYVNLHKAVLPDLWTFLSSGSGYTVARRVYPLLLPFLKELSKVHSSPQSLYDTFLDKLIVGVAKDLSRSSYGGEFEAIMESYVQCYTFIFSMTTNDLGDNSDDNLFTQQLIIKISDVIKTCFTAEKLSRSTFHTVMHAMYKLITELLCDHSDVVIVQTHLEHIRSTILTEVSLIIEATDSTKDNYFTRVSDSLVLFGCYKDTNPIIYLHLQADEDSNKKLLFDFLHPIAIRTCSTCLKILNEHSSLLHAKLLSHTIQHYGTKDLLLTVGKEIKHDGSSSHGTCSGDSLADFLDYVLLTLVRCQCEKEELVENLVEVLLLVTCECPNHLAEILVENVEANKVMEKLTALILLKRSTMKLDLDDLSVVESSIDKMVLSIESSSCSKVPFMWQLLEAVLTKPDEQLLSLQHSTTMLKSLCSKITKSNNLPFHQDNLRYCKLISQADSVFLNKVNDDIYQFLYILLCSLCDQNEDIGTLSVDLTVCYQETSSKVNLKSYFDWLLPKLVDHLTVKEPSLSRCLEVSKVLRGLHTDVDASLVLSSMSYKYQVDVLPVVVADRMCHGKVVIEPESHSIESFENKPISDILPSDLYSAILTAVFCSSDKDKTGTDNQDEMQKHVNCESKLPLQGVTDALISFGVASLFLESSTSDLERQTHKMVCSATQQLTKRVSAEKSLCEVVDAIMMKYNNDYVLMESVAFVLQSLDTLTTEETTAIISILTINISNTQLCTRYNGVCFAELLGKKIFTNHSNYYAYGHPVQGLVLCLLTAQSNNSDWDFIIYSIKLLMEHQHLVDYDSFDDASYRNVSYLSLEMFTMLVMSGKVSDDCWDFILCSVVTVMQLFDDKVEITVPVSILHCSILRLCLQLNMHFAKSAQHNLITEWKDFFSPAITDAVILQFKHVLKNRKSCDSHFMRVEEFLCCKLLTSLCKEPVSHFSVSEVVEYLYSGSYPVQVTAYYLLTRMLKFAIFGKKDESQNLDEWVTMLKSTVTMSQQKLSDDRSVTDNSDGNTAAYMLAWLLCVAFLRDTDHGSEMRMQLLEWIKETGAAEALVCELITHIPVQSFSNHDHIDVSFTADITNLSMMTFKAVAQQLPVVLRQWFITLDRKAASLVEEFTKKYITPLLWKDQLASFEASPRSFDNMEVRLGKDTPEVMIKYRIDDTAGIELVMLLSDAHPLYLPTITQERGIKVNIGNWKKWILQLNSYIGNQNGTLLQGLSIWKANLDKHFAGMEDCMICFSVIHHSNQSLPRLTCKTCKKKFHNICLYKWFSTSAKSTCPLCRNIF